MILAMGHEHGDDPTQGQLRDLETKGPCLRKDPTIARAISSFPFHRTILLNTYYNLNIKMKMYRMLGVLWPV